MATEAEQTISAWPYRRFRYTRWNDPRKRRLRRSSQSLIPAAWPGSVV